jgi:DNA-binding NtrC family response regulator
MQSGTVVVVEDDPLLNSIAVSMFEDYGIAVVAFSNADDALAHMHDHAASIGAIFTDLQMPGQMDGLVLAEIAGRHWPGVTVLLTSGRVKPMAALPPNVRFIGKPWSPSQVLRELELAAERRDTGRAMGIAQTMREKAVAFEGRDRMEREDTRR